MATAQAQDIKRPEPSDHAVLDAAIARLQENKARWVALPLREKIRYAKSIVTGTHKVAEAQVKAACAAKGVEFDGPRAGEDWLGGPAIQIRVVRLLVETLEAMSSGRHPHFDPSRVRARTSGQVVAEVFPMNTMDKLLYGGFTAEVWMEPEVTMENLADHVGAIHRPGAEVEPKVALVLGAGNVASIGPLDVVHKLFFEGQVSLLKMNPVNAYLGPFVEQAFGELIRDGFVQMAYGGAEVGEYLVHHEGIDEIHITGSDRTHDVIVFGPGEAGAEAKKKNEPRIDKRITSELGNVSPVIVVPGTWSEKELAFQAENVATQMTQNGGFNCNAAKLLVLSKGWPQKEAFLTALRDVLKSLPPRPAYYPGAQDRWDRFTQTYPQHETFGQKTGEALPWTLIPGLDAADEKNMAFSTESFCAVTGVTELDGDDVPSFLDRAVRFCNETLWGTLNAAVLVDPRTVKRNADALENAISRLRYGTVAVNHWPALAFGLGTTTWGAFPGHTLNDIQSGIGAVHNTQLWDRPQKTVIRGPFTMPMKPPWFVTHARAHEVGRRLTDIEASPSMLKLPGLVAHVLRG